MDAVTTTPLRVTGPSALLWGRRFARDPLIATQRLFEQCGPFVVLAEAIPLTRRARAPMLGIPLVFTAGAAFNGAVLADPDVWRGASVLPRLTGERHAHYRKLLGQPLRRVRVEALWRAHGRYRRRGSSVMAAPRAHRSLDRIRQTMQRFAVELLFGGGEQTRTIAELCSRAVNLL